VVSSPVVTVDQFYVTPTTVTSTTQAITISMHFAGSNVNYAYLYFTPTGVGYIGYFYDSGAVTDNWFNITAQPLNMFSTDGDLQTGTFVPYLQVYANNIDLYVRVQPRDLRASLGVLPTVTLSGAAFSANHVAPHCNFTFPTGPLNVDAAQAVVRLSAVCDGNGAPYSSQWFLAGPPATSMFFDGAEQAVSTLGNTVNVAQGGAPGTYSVAAIWLSDQDGNVAVYSNNRPPFLSSMLAGESFGEGWLYGDELNVIFGEATTSGAHAIRGVVAVYAACAAFVAAAWRHL